MSRITKNLITSIIGIALMILGGVMFYSEKEMAQSVAAFSFGVLLLFAKDKLIKKFLGVKDRPDNENDNE